GAGGGVAHPGRRGRQGARRAGPAPRGRGRGARRRALRPPDRPPGSRGGRRRAHARGDGALPGAAPRADPRPPRRHRGAGGARPRMIRRRGTLFVVSAPSGAGKTTLCREARLGVPGLAYSVSVTTRAPRPGEIDGVDFRFVDEASFRAMLGRGEFAEWATVHG